MTFHSCKQTLALGAFILALCSGIPVSAFFKTDYNALHWQNENRKSIRNAKESPVCFVGTIPSRNDLLKASFEEGSITIDTRDFYALPDLKKEVILHIPGIQKDDGVRIPADPSAERTWNCYQIKIQGTPGAKIALVFEGRRDKKFNNGHFRVDKEFILDGTEQTIVHKLELPQDVTGFGIRLDLKSAGVFRFQAPDFYTEPKQKQVFPAANYLYNGGAENGFDNTVYLPLKNRAHATAGSFVNYRGEKEQFDIELECDSRIVHSGKYSFSILFRGKGPMTSRVDSFAFNPVPLIPDAPYTFTVYARAERKTRAELVLYLGGGNGENKYFDVGTEWTKLQLHVPAWTKNKMYAESGMIIPTIVAQPNVKLWFDDACVTIGPHREVAQKTDFFFRNGKLDKPNQYYFHGEKLHAEVVMEQTSGKDVSGTAEWEILDFKGESIQKQTIGEKTLKSGKPVQEKFTLALPAHVRGPHNLVFSFRDNTGKTHSRTFYFGVVGTPGKPSPKIALEAAASQDVRLLIPFYRDFGIGGVRLGSASGSVPLALENIRFFHNAGIDVMVNYSPEPAARIDSDSDMAKFYSQFRADIKKYGHMITTVESWNEANVASGKGMTVQRNASLIHEMKKILKETAPQIRLAGPDPCKTDFAWIVGVLSAGAAKDLDIVSEHPYRPLPESPDYAQDAGSVRKIIDRFNPEIAYWATESGRQFPSSLPDNRLCESVNLAAARDIRTMLLGFNSGVDRYFQFCISTWSVANAQNPLFMGNRTNGGALLPGPLLFAMRNLGDRIGNAKAAGRVSLGYRYKALLFDKGVSGSVCSLWKFSGEKAEIKLDPRDTAATAVYDMYGTKLDSSKPFEISEFPVYLETRGNSAELASVLKRSKIFSNDGTLLEAEAQPISSKEIRIRLRNAGIQTVKNIKIEIEKPDLIEGNPVRDIESVEIEESKDCFFRLKNAVGLEKTVLPLKISASGKTIRMNTNLCALMIPKTESGLQIDGDLSDWKTFADAELTGRNAVILEKKLWTDAEKKIRAKLRYAWDENYFYIAAELFKNTFNESPLSAPLSSIWNSDSLQVCFDTLHNGQPEQTGFQDDDFEYSLGVAGGKPVVFRQTGSSSVYDSLPKPPGKISDVKFAVRREDGKTFFEAAFPRQTVSPLKLAPGSLMRTSLIINLMEHGKRIGYLELTPGIGGAKSPGQWMDAVLIP